MVEAKKNKEITNTELMKKTLETLYTITTRRTSPKFSQMIINDLLKSLSNKFDFLKGITIKQAHLVEYNKDIVIIQTNLENIQPLVIGKAIESLVRVLSRNMKNDEAVLYFISELKDKIDIKYITKLLDYGVDLDIIQFEQHYLHKQKKQKTKIKQFNEQFKDEKEDKDNNTHYVSLLPYTWENVGYWKYENNICTIFDKKGQILDKLALDKIVKSYMMKMTGFKKLPLQIKKPVELTEKEYHLLKMLYSKDIDAATAMHYLKVTKDELNVFIRKLLIHEALQYVAHDEVMLTEKGIKLASENYIEN